MLDLRYALRGLRRSPGFAIAAIGCLALGIGVNAAIYSTVRSIVEPNTMVRDIDAVVVASEARLGPVGVSYLNFRDWQAQATSFASMAAWKGRSFALASKGASVHVHGLYVSAGFFDLLGVRPALGRPFVPADDRAGAAPVVILSWQAWSRLLASDSTLLGATVWLDGAAYTVVGVMPDGFGFPQDEALWIPLAPAANRHDRAARDLVVAGRLRTKIDLTYARADLDAVAERLRHEYPASNGDWSISLTTLRKRLEPADANSIVLALTGSAAFILLIACLNVANLLLARAAEREHEIMVRRAIGGTRWALARLHLTESILLAVAGGVFGLALALAGLRSLGAAVPAGELPYYVRWRMDWPIVAFLVVLTAATGIAFGFVPAWLRSAEEGGNALRRSPGGKGIGKYVRYGFVFAEIALSLVLLVGASLFLQSYFNLRHADPGFRTDSQLTFRTYLPGEQFSSALARSQFVEQLIERILAMPGVESVGAASALPFSDPAIMISNVEAVGGAQGPWLPVVRRAGVTRDMSAALGLTLIRGRAFADAELLESSPTSVALVTETMVRQTWGTVDPIGRQIRFRDDTGHTYTVIGVLRDVRGLDPRQPVPAGALIPLRNATFTNPIVVVHTTLANPAELTPAIRGAVAAINPSAPVNDLHTMAARQQLAYWDRVLLGKIFIVFGALGLVLAATGVYGTVSYIVSQRTHEIGVRMALGAQATAIQWHVVRESLAVTLGGLSVGLLLAYLLAGVLRAQLYGVNPVDPRTLIGISGFLTLVAVLASLIPARRAASADPLRALRAQ